jgi:hypothetical protein
MRPLLGLTAVVLFFPGISYAQTQDWSAVQALPRETRVVVRELGGRGGHVRGRLLLANDSEVTVLRGGRPVVIPKAMIGRIDEIRRDRVWEGAVIGVLYALIMRAVFAGGACLGPEPECTLKGAAMAAGVGALIDYGMDDERVIYRAAKTSRSQRQKPAVTLLRLSF